MKSWISKTIDGFNNAIRSLPNVLLKLFFSNNDLCYFCKGEGNVVCKDCSATMSRHEGNLCEKCGRSITQVRKLCDMCKRNSRPYDKGYIVFYYEGIAREAMKEFKFENKLLYADFFAEEIFKKVKELEGKIDLVTAVPSHFLKVFGKGYNPPALIARKVAKLMDLKYDGKLLQRTRYTKSMSLLKKIDRMAHVKKNFSANTETACGKNILIIDDVSTTGATLHICSKLLKDAGTDKIYVAAVCGDTH